MTHPRIALSASLATAALSATLLPATAFAQAQVLSDTLTVTFDGVTQTRTIP